MRTTLLTDPAGMSTLKFFFYIMQILVVCAAAVGGEPHASKLGLVSGELNYINYCFLNIFVVLYMLGQDLVGQLLIILHGVNGSEKLGWL